MSIAITPLYAGAIAILMAVLATLTSITRGKTQVALGDDGNSQMALSIRRFGNLSEYAAMALVVLLLMELSGIPPFWLHTYGIALIALRLLHPFILFDSMDAPGIMKFGRFVAGAGTAMLLLVAGVLLVLNQM